MSTTNANVAYVVPECGPTDKHREAARKFLQTLVEMEKWERIEAVANVLSLVENDRADDYIATLEEVVSFLETENDHLEQKEHYYP